MTAIRTRYVATVLLVKSIRVSGQFYTTMLGQEIVEESKTRIAFAGGLVLWQADAAHLEMFDRTAGKPIMQGRENCELSFETEEDLESTYQTLCDAGVQPVHNIYSHSAGRRAFRVYDPDGHIVKIAAIG